MSCAVTGPVNLRATLPSGASSQVIGSPRGTSKSFGGAYTSTSATGYTTGCFSRKARIASGVVSS